MNNTDKICEQYISQIKYFFPLIGKKEKDYLQKLQTTLNDYCEQSVTVSLDSLYTEFGTPSNIVADYFSDTNINDIVKRVRKDKSLKRISFCLIACLIIVLIGCSIRIGINFKNYNQAISDSAQYYEEIIE
ncbi:MAG: DUF6120 family protein [Lachnospiraceae bacterium]|nr:DUF6120 family protein [Lachnospiraceae bacterium]